MLPFLICILTVQQVHSACMLQGVCPDKNATVQVEIVDRHNDIRRNVKPSASDMLQMSYSDDIAATAQAWVDKCILAHGPISSRLYNGYQLGENLFYSSKLFSWTDVINAWYSEVANYHYPTGSINNKTTGHYTQVVWNSSYRVGCGVKLCPNNIYFYGCHYYRAGNFRFWPPYKAGPPCDSCPEHCVDKLCTNPCADINHFLNCRSLTHYPGCSNKYVIGWCPASCRCPTEIIPIG